MSDYTTTYACRLVLMTIDKRFSFYQITKNACKRQRRSNVTASNRNPRQIWRVFWCVSDMNQLQPIYFGESKHYVNQTPIAGAKILFIRDIRLLTLNAWYGTARCDWTILYAERTLWASGAKARQRLHLTLFGTLRWMVCIHSPPPQTPHRYCRNMFSWKGSRTSTKNMTI